MVPEVKRICRGVVRAEAADGTSFGHRQLTLPFFERDERRVWTFKLANQLQVAHNQFWFDIRSDPLGKLGAAIRIERHHQNTAKDAAVERRDPFSAVLGPEDNTIACANVLLLEECREPAGQPRNVAVGGNAPPVALVADYSDLAAVAAKVLN